MDDFEVDVTKESSIFGTWAFENELLLQAYLFDLSNFTPRLRDLLEYFLNFISSLNAYYKQFKIAIRIVLNQINTIVSSMSV